MESEGKKEAEARQYRNEDEAASRGMRMILGCGGERKENLTDNLLLKAKTLMILKSDERTTGRTLEVESPVLRLNKLTCWGKRQQEGGVESPSKRARTFDNLKKRTPPVGQSPKNMGNQGTRFLRKV